jgi:hypothetical protein
VVPENQEESTELLRASPLKISHSQKLEFHTLHSRFSDRSIICVTKRNQSAQLVGSTSTQNPALVYSICSISNSATTMQDSSAPRGLLFTQSPYDIFQPSFEGSGSSVSYFRRLDDGIECGFRQAATIEQHGILGPAGDRQVTAPRLAVMHAPKRDPAEYVSVFSEK